MSTAPSATLTAITYDDFSVLPGPVDFSTLSSFIQWVFPVDRSQECFEKIEKERQLLQAMVDATHPFSHNSRLENLRGIQSIWNATSLWRRYVGMQKVEETARTIKKEIKENKYDKLVLFAVHRDVMESLRVKFMNARINCVTLYAGTPMEKLQKQLERFNKNPKCRILIANILSAGTSTDLTVANHALFIEPMWNPFQVSQAVMRLRRMGQTRAVNIRFVGLKDSLDEKIVSRLKLAAWRMV